jgi:hypothetical protein
VGQKTFESNRCVFSGPKTPTEEKNEKMRKSKKNNAEEEKM